MNFWFCGVCKNYAYIILWSSKCAIAFYLKKQCTYLNLKMLLKNANHHLSLLNKRRR